VSASEREIERLRQRIRELEHLLRTHLRSDDLQMESGVSARSGEPFMHLRWGDQAGQFTPAKAREHALAILDAAAASEFDAALVKVLIDRFSMTQELAVHFLGEIREARGGTDQASRVDAGAQPENEP